MTPLLLVLGSAGVVEPVFVAVFFCELIALATLRGIKGNMGYRMLAAIHNRPCMHRDEAPVIALALSLDLQPLSPSTRSPTRVVIINGGRHHGS